MRVALYYYYIVQFAPLIPVGYAVRHYRLLDRPLRLFFWYLVSSLLMTAFMVIAAFVWKNNLWLMNLYAPAHVFCILWTLSLWHDRLFLRRILRWSIVAFVLVWSVELGIEGTLLEFTTVMLPTQGVLLLAAALLTIDRLNRRAMEPLINMPQFWISTGVMLQFGGLIVITLLTAVLSKLSQETLRPVLLLQPMLTLIASLLYTEGFRCLCRPQSFSGLPSSAQPSL